MSIHPIDVARARSFAAREFRSAHELDRDHPVAGVVGAVEIVAEQPEMAVRAASP
jgi:hypothetical protein